MAGEVVLITRGAYADRQVLAAASDRVSAQEWADRWNLEHLDALRGPDDKAVVGDTVPYIGGDR